jgi:hypothetical protein
MAVVSDVCPAAVAVRLLLPTATPVTPKVTLLVPPGTVTDFGAVATAGSTPDRVTGNPVFAGATSLIEMVTLTVFPTPGAIGWGAMVNVARFTGGGVGVLVEVTVAVGVLVLLGVAVVVGEATPVLVGVGVAVAVLVGPPPPTVIVPCIRRG